MFPIFKPVFINMIIRKKKSCDMFDFGNILFFFFPGFPLWTLNIRLNEIKSARPGHCLSTPPLMCDFIRPNADVKQFYRTAVCTQIA